MSDSTTSIEEMKQVVDSLLKESARIMDGVYANAINSPRSRFISGLPICAVCRKPVDVLQKIPDMARYRVKYIAKCHGKVEVCYLDDRLVADADNIAPGYAFLEEAKELEEKRNDGTHNIKPSRPLRQS